jgi:hypothetical protein
MTALLDRLRDRIQAVLAGDLIGLYLYGSLVWGDFDPAISDIDLLAVTAGVLGSAELSALEQMHADFAAAHPAWDNRVEVAYVSASALQTFKTQPSEIAVISPGEPFHTKSAAADWLINWYFVRERGVTLAGPPPQSIIIPIAKAEFIQAVRNQARSWRGWVERAAHRKAQAYAILTLCRALYVVRNGEQVSKLRAAQWAQRELPEWSALIASALAWRAAPDDPAVDHAATLPATRQFVHFVADLIAPASPQ